MQAALGMFPVIGIAFAVLPQGTFPGASKVTPIAGGPVRQAIIALRPVAVLMPLMIYMLGGEIRIIRSGPTRSSIPDSWCDSLF